MIEKADSKSDVKLLVTTITQAIKGYSVIIALLIAFLRLYPPRYVVFGSILGYLRIFQGKHTCRLVLQEYGPVL